MQQLDPIDESLTVPARTILDLCGFTLYIYSTSPKKIPKRSEKCFQDDSSMLFSLFIWFPFFLGGGAVEYDRHSLLDTESDGVFLADVVFSNYNVVFSC